jgi:anthranilate/para-aminobenzoate synthase component I
MFARVLSLPPDPVLLAARVEAAGLPLVSLVAGGELSFVAAAPADHSHALDPHAAHEAGAADQPAAAGELARVPRWIGVVPYEARRGLERPAWSPADARGEPAIARPSWLRYDAVLRIDRASGEVLAAGDAAAEVERLARAAATELSGARAPLALELGPLPAAAEHLTRVARARELILAGDLYQVNLARRFELRLRGGSRLELFRLTRGARFGAVVPVPAARGGECTAISLSPELLLRAECGADGGFSRLRTEPIKGTRPRGRDAPSDRRLAEELDRDPKERAELAMIIDVERGDLARVCQAGTVRLFGPPFVRTHATVHHREVALGGVVRPGVARSEVLEAMLPSGSVTGAPKVRAMEVIAALESHRRGLYTGGIGYVARDGSVELGMAIRTLVLQGEAGWYWTGGGIVADSDPERELVETEWKARRLLELCSRAPA